MENEYKWLRQDHTKILQYPERTIFENGNGWQEFQDYLSNGGQVDPFRTFNEWIINALTLLRQEHDRIIFSHGLSDNTKQGKKDSRLTNALYKKVKGIASVSDIKILDDNDLLDSWYDDMEVAAESTNHGEAWIEDQERNEQELIDYDPSLVPWPEYPL